MKKQFSLSGTFSIGSLMVAALISVAAQPSLAATINEFVGPNVSVSPQAYGAASSGTYYHPTAIEANGYVFLFVQGGQFSSINSPLSWCEGDKVLMYRAPHTAPGVNGGFTPQLRVSPCDSSPTHRVHWTMTSAYHSTTDDTIRLIAERQSINKSGGYQESTSIWLFKGNFSISGETIPNWQYYKLFETVAGSPGRIESFVISSDTSRTAPQDGYSHELLRGFARKPSNKTVEFRMDISNAHCNNSSSLSLCSRIEFKKNGSWKPVLGGQFNFVPDTLISSFRPNNIVLRNGQMELWGARLTAPGNNNPCVTNKPSARFSWYTIDPLTFTLGLENQLTSSLRPMPAEPHTTRMGVDVVTLPGGFRQYLVTGDNDDQACSLTNPFVGIDVVTTRIQ